MSCRTHYTEELKRAARAEDCEECQKDFDSASSYCGICWKIVTNKVYLAKNSLHVSGKCRARHSIPRSIFQRTVDKKPSYPWPDGWHTPLKENCLIPYQWLKLDGSPLFEAVTGEEIETDEEKNKTVDGEGTSMDRSSDREDDETTSTAIGEEPDDIPANEINNPCWIEIDRDREIELLKEQNALLRQLATL
jgi:hypothetical protein